jgi:hypothetical protein
MSKRLVRPGIASVLRRGWAAGNLGFGAKNLKGMTVRDFLSEAMLAIVIVIGGAVSLFIVTAFLLIMGQHTWLDNF